MSLEHSKNYKLILQVPITYKYSLLIPGLVRTWCLIINQSGFLTAKELAYGQENWFQSGTEYLLRPKGLTRGAGGRAIVTIKLCDRNFSKPEQM